MHLTSSTNFIVLGNVYIADCGNGLIHKLTVSTGVITPVAGTGTNEFSGDGGQATSAGLVNPTKVALDAAGNIYIAHYGNDRVRKVTASTGIIDTIAGWSGATSFLGDESAATSANLLYPTAAVVDSDGNIYIADLYNHRIRKVTKSTGIITTYAGTGSCDYSGDGGEATAATFYRPADVALDSSGNVYIADSLNSRVRKVTASTGIITSIAGADDIENDDDGDDYDGDGFTGDGGPAISAALNEPNGIALDSSGRATTRVIHFFAYI